MTDLNEFVIDAWIEECEREENPADFVQRFFQDNQLKGCHRNTMTTELEDWVSELFELMGVQNERMIKLMLNTMDWKLIENSIQTYYNEELKQYHTPYEQLSAEAQFFAIIDKEMKERATIC